MVVEAKKRVPSVEVAKRLKRALVLIAAAVVEVPMKTESVVVVGARKLGSILSRMSHAWPICVLVSVPVSSVPQTRKPCASVSTSPVQLARSAMRSAPASTLIPLPKVEVAVD